LVVRAEHTELRVQMRYCDRHRHTKIQWNERRAEFSGVGLGGRLQTAAKEFKKVYDA